MGILLVAFLWFMRRRNVENKYTVMAISLMVVVLAGTAMGASIQAALQERFLPKVKLCLRSGTMLGIRELIHWQDSCA